MTGQHVDLEGGVVVVRWSHIGAVAGLVAAGALGLFAWFDGRVSDLREDIAAVGGDAGKRIDGREAEDRDIRALIQASDDTLRSEMGGLRSELSKLGDRLVQANGEVGIQISKMREEVIATMREGDARLERRFDKLDEKFDTLLGKINYETIIIPWTDRQLVIDQKGTIIDPDGKILGTLPAVIKYK